jgi:hypothetical protein
VNDIIRKFFYGNRRYSRLYDEKGNLIEIKYLVKHGPLALGTGILRYVFGYRPVLPWISYGAIDYLRNFLDKEKTVLEFGSGMSTLWYAEHAKHVSSVEDYHAWFSKVKTQLAGKNITNVEYVFQIGNAYTGFKQNSGEKYDLIMIDGSDRHHCALNAINLVREGGIIYLDNSDKHSDTFDGDTKLAESILLDYAKRLGGEVVYFTDFAPTAFFVQQGMCCHFHDT